MSRSKSRSRWCLYYVDLTNGRVKRVMDDITKSYALELIQRWKARQEQCVLIAWPQWGPEFTLALKLETELDDSDESDSEPEPDSVIPLSRVEYESQKLAMKAYFDEFLKRVNKANELGLVNTPMAFGRVTGCMEDFTTLINGGDEDDFLSGHIETGWTKELDAVLGV